MTSRKPVPAEPWRKAVLAAGVTLRQAVRNLDESAQQIALVVSEDGVLLGTLTDGDIRRGLLRGLDLDCAIDGLISREPLVVPEVMSRDTVLQLMQTNRIHQLPEVDRNHRSCLDCRRVGRGELRALSAAALQYHGDHGGRAWHAVAALCVECIVPSRCYP